jgi:hypothetical protein
MHSSVTVSDMNRDPYKAVMGKESFALLVQAIPPLKATGEATFGLEVGTPVPVHPVTLDELTNTAKKLRGADALELSALLALRGALEARDGLAEANAKERLEQALRQRRKELAERLPETKESREEFGRVLAHAVGLPPEESLQHYEGLLPGLQSMKNPSRLLSWAVSSTIGMWPQLVLWSVNGRFIPAIFCAGLNRDHAMKTALYVHTFLIAPTGELGFRVCPYCTESFFQDRPNQDYCQPAHREAHRVKRARWRKKNQDLEAQKRLKGVRNVTRKTR